MTSRVIHIFGASGSGTTTLGDNGGLNMRSKAKHDEWQKLLLCPLIRLDGSDSLEHNFKIVQRYI